MLTIARQFQSQALIAISLEENCELQKRLLMISWWYKHLTRDWKFIGKFYFLNPTYIVTYKYLKYTSNNNYNGVKKFLMSQRNFFSPRCFQWLQSNISFPRLCCKSCLIFFYFGGILTSREMVSVALFLSVKEPR